MDFVRLVNVSRILLHEALAYPHIYFLGGLTWLETVELFILEQVALK